MVLWFVLALMTAAAVFAVLWPLGRRKPLRTGSDIAVYRDQLEEIERDRSAGLIGEREAEAARIEVSRRLLAAADTAAPARSAAGMALRHRIAAFAALFLLPIGAVSFYLLLGSPKLPGQPLEARRDGPFEERRSTMELVAKIESYLQVNPEDGKAWDLVGPVYMRLGQYDDAVRARKNSLRLSGPTAQREADLGEALTGAANGIVTAEAKQAFDRAEALDPRDVRVRFFRGLIAEQDGRPKEAAAIWQALLADAPPGADWAGFVRESLARVDPRAVPAARPGPNPAEMAAANDMTPEQRSSMIQGMVARLAERLKRDGSDVDGWVMLVRSYSVLGAAEQARTATDEARRALAGEPEKLRYFNETVARETAAASAPSATEVQKPQPQQPGPSAADIAAANEMSPEQRNTMIRGMVGRLAERLKQDGSDVEGWLRLLRAYAVLGEHDKARNAADDARRALAGDPAKLRRIDEFVAGGSSSPTPPAVAAVPPPPMPGPSAADVKAADDMSPDQRNTMIRGMVARLAERLKQDGSDVEGWLRLLRSYIVLGDKDQARAAAAEARRALASDPAKLRKVDEFVKELGLEG
jgi:cytochrome c-type biogenesis protein CcmH